MKTRFGLGHSLLLGGLFALGSLAARPAMADMDLNIDTLSANGMEVRKLSCKLSSGGLLGSVLIVAELAKHKDAFDKCATSAGAAFATEFTWRDGKSTAAKVSASSEAKANACIAAELKKTKPVVFGTCIVTLLTGNKAKAEAAAAELSKK